MNASDTTETSDTKPVSGDTLPLPLDTGGVTAPPDDKPEHLARCRECAFTVRYKSSASGAGFTLVGSDASLGIGDNGRPICPNGHGELAIADDQLPAAEAISQVAEQLDSPRPQRIPFPVPPFNYEGALHAIIKKRQEVSRLEMKFNDADDRKKKAKAALDGANEELGEMIDEFEKREQDRSDEIARRELQAEKGHPEDTNLVHCTYEQAHPGETCPLCEQDAMSVSLDRTPRDSAQHVEQALKCLERRRMVALQDKLDDAANVIVTEHQVRSWSDELRAEVEAWADDAARAPEERERWGRIRPRALAGLHVAGDRSDDEQLCRDCGAIMLKFGDADVDDDPYPTGTLVGSDCPGAARPEPSHHYPEKGKKKKGGRKAVDVPAAAAEVPPAAEPQPAVAMTPQPAAVATTDDYTF